MSEPQLTNNEATAEIVSRIDTIEKRLQAIPTEDRIAEIVENTLINYFTKKGTTVKSMLLGTAVVIGAIAVIFGGLKALLGWIGFSYLGK